jgi:hypothetical protein
MARRRLGEGQKLGRRNSLQHIERSRREEIRGVGHGSDSR